MAKYIELKKLLNDIYNNKEPFNISNVIKIVCNQPTLDIHDCEDCMFKEECETMPMGCSSFLAIYSNKLSNTRL